MIINPAIFKDYDIRATVPDQIDSEGVYHLGLALLKYFSPKTVSIGRDMRQSSADWRDQLTKSFIKHGVDVIDLGLITTDMSYFASATLKPDLSLMITASHNPPEYNGLKIVKKGAVAVSGEKGIYAIRDLLKDGQLTPTPSQLEGNTRSKDIWPAWVEHCLKIVPSSGIKPLKVVMDGGNGMAGMAMQHFSPRLPLKLTGMYFELDGSFPNHLPYPLMQETTDELRKRVVSGGFDLGVAWDGDADRMFLIDDKGEFVDGTALGGLLADYLLEKNPTDKVIYNAVIGREVEDVIKFRGGTAIRWRVGHTLLKEKMQAEKALLAVEHSGHFFFRDNFGCDSGILTLLYALEIISKDTRPLSEILKKYRKYPASGEINFKVEDKEAVMRALEKEYQSSSTSIDWLDGISVWFPDWWFNVRPSNTQPLLRLNVEVNSGDLAISEKVKEIVSKIETLGGTLVKE